MNLLYSFFIPSACKKLFNTPKLIANISFSFVFSIFSSLKPFNTVFNVSISVWLGSKLSVASLWILNLFIISLYSSLIYANRCDFPSPTLPHNNTNCDCSELFASFISSSNSF